MAMSDIYLMCSVNSKGNFATLLSFFHCAAHGSRTFFSTVHPWRAIWFQIESNQQVFPPLDIVQKLVEICTKGIFSTEINFTRSDSQMCIIH